MSELVGNFVLLMCLIRISIIFVFVCARYDALSSCLVDFKGRASIASVKNFQLIKSEPMLHKHTGPPPMAGADPRSIHLQMGKVRLFE